MTDRAALQFKQRPVHLVELLEPRTLLAVAAYFEAVPITPAAIAADPVLVNYETWDLKVRVWPADSYTVSDLLAGLRSGTFYNHADGGHVAQPGLWQRFPQLEFDTWVSAPKPEATKIPGRGDDQPGPPIFTDTQISVTWGEINEGGLTGAGDWTIARMTVTKGAVGTLRGRIGHLTIDPGDFVHYRFEFGQAVPPPSQPPAAPPPPPPPGPPPGSPPSPPPAPSGTGSVTGAVFVDRNNDGRRDSGDGVVSGHVVWSDANNNGNLDPGEHYTRTRADGTFILNRLEKGRHTIRVRLSGGFWSTTPDRGVATANITRENQRIPVGTFGITDRVVVRGLLFQDVNLNGRFDANDRPINGALVYFDANLNGRFDAGESTVITGRNGTWTLEIRSRGTVLIAAAGAQSQVLVIRPGVPPPSVLLARR